MFRKLALVAVAFLMSTECLADTCEYTIERVAYKNLVANLYRPKTHHTVPVVIAFGGSEGGLSTGNSSGEMLAPNCIAVLGLAYFKETGLPATLDQIPLEYFIDAIDYVSRAQGIDAARIGIGSGSRGSEAALLVASMDARIKSVVVATPSEVAWSGMATAKSAWTYQGTDVPALSLDGAQSLPQLKRFENALDNIENGRKYRIPVERINGPIFLISAENDQIWPSRRMSEDVVKYLRLQNFRFQVRHDSYPTGHGFNKELAPKIKQTVVDRFLDTL
jgi:dienelactone hydrolase